MKGLTQSQKWIVPASRLRGERPSLASPRVTLGPKRKLDASFFFFLQCSPEGKGFYISRTAFETKDRSLDDSTPSFAEVRIRNVGPLECEIVGLALPDPRNSI